jgi:hypothetical protein
LEARGSQVILRFTVSAKKEQSAVLSCVRGNPRTERHAARCGFDLLVFIYQLKARRRESPIPSFSHQYSIGVIYRNLAELCSERWKILLTLRDMRNVPNDCLS